MDKKIMLRRMRRSPQFVVGSILVVFLLFIALFSEYLAPCDPNAVNTAIRLKPPGIIDNIVMRGTEVTMAVPTLTLGIVIVAVFGASIPNLILIMVVNAWNGFARIARNNVMVIKNREFVQASKVFPKYYNASDHTGQRSVWKYYFGRILFKLSVSRDSGTAAILGEYDCGLPEFSACCSMDGDCPRRGADDSGSWIQSFG